MDTMNKLIRSDVTALAQYPIVRSSGYDTIKYNVGKALKYNIDLLEVPAAPILLTLGSRNSEYEITVKFYASTLELFNVAMTDIILKYKDCLFTNFVQFVKRSKFVTQLNHLVEDEVLDKAVHAICTNIAKDRVLDSEVLGVIRNTPETLPLIEALNQVFIYLPPKKFNSVENLRYFIENNAEVSIFLIKEIRVDGSEFGLDNSYGSSLIHPNLLGIFDIKFVSETMEGYVSIRDLTELCRLFNGLSAEERTLEQYRKIAITNFSQEIQEFIDSFLASLWLKEVYKC